MAATTINGVSGYITSTSGTITYYIPTSNLDSTELSFLDTANSNKGNSTLEAYLKTINWSTGVTGWQHFSSYVTSYDTNADVYGELAVEARTEMGTDSRYVLSGADGSHAGEILCNTAYSTVTLSIADSGKIIHVAQTAVTINLPAPSSPVFFTIVSVAGNTTLTVPTGISLVGPDGAAVSSIVVNGAEIVYMHADSTNVYYRFFKTGRTIVHNAVNANEAVSYGQANGRYKLNGSDPSYVLEYSGDTTLSAADTGKIIQLQVAGTITLPSASKGLNYLIMGNPAGNTTITASTGTIYLPDGSSASSYVIGTSSGWAGSIELYADDSGSNWRIVNVSGRTVVANAVNANEAISLGQGDGRYAPIAGNTGQTLDVANATVGTQEAVPISQLETFIAPYIPSGNPTSYPGSASPGTVSLGSAPRGLCRLGGFYSDSPIGTTSSLYGLLYTAATDTNDTPTSSGGSSWFYQTLYKTNGDIWVRQNINGGGWSTWVNSNGGSAGAVSYFAMSGPPTGWLKANGAAVSRSVYASLFAAIGTTWGAGDGSTTFNVPDLRGYFLRPWDNGRGIDSGRAFASGQGDTIRNITGTFNGYTQNDQSGNSTSGPFTSNGATLRGPQNTDNNVEGQNITTMDLSRSVPTSSEVRPKNIALLACIKY